MSTDDDTAAGETSPAPGGVDARHDPGPDGVSASLRAAAIASLGAGAIHATAVGMHSEHRSAVLAFATVAALQIGWGALALVRTGRAVAVGGLAVNAAALGGWLMAKSSGIGFVDGLDVQESPQFADTLAAAFALVAVLGAFVTVAGPRTWTSRPHPALVGVAAVATVALVVPGMVSTGSHDHAAGDHAAGEHAAGDHAAGEHGDHAAAASTPPVPYDATLPVDLGGVPGVSAADQADAEALVTESLETLPKFADIPTIEAMGYHSIGDGATGHEHFMKWDLIDDGRVLDPEYPESLVFVVDRETGEKTLGAAMYMANPGDTLDTAPTVGGDLVQWHIHDNLCYRGEPGKWTVGGVAPPDQDCPEGTQRLSDNPVPMVHVWIIPHECGPFSALDGIGAGQVAEGEEKLCDHAHGAAT